jgi:hypothetical protein
VEAVQRRLLGLVSLLFLQQELLLLLLLLGHLLPVVVLGASFADGFVSSTKAGEG